MTTTDTTGTIDFTVGSEDGGAVSCFWLANRHVTKVDKRVFSPPRIEKS